MRLNLPPPTEKSTVGPGDVFTLEVVGEKELPREYQVASDGSVDIPYLQTVQVGVSSLKKWPAWSASF